MGSYTRTGFCPAMIPCAGRLFQLVVSCITRRPRTYQEQLDRSLLVRVVECRLNRPAHALARIADETRESSFPTPGHARIQRTSTRVDLGKCVPIVGP